jgi:hypothetical protein
MSILQCKDSVYEYGQSQGNVTDGKTEDLREIPVTVPLCPLQIPHGLTWASMVRGW